MAVPDEVFVEDFETGEPSGFERSDQAAHEGSFGARPAMLPAGGTAQFTLDCGERMHTQVEFVFKGTAALLVDGERYESPIEGDHIGGYWQRKKIVIPAGVHSYAWQVTAENAGRPAFSLDTITCSTVEAEPVTTSTWGFDQGFPPQEFEGFTGEPDARWQITNSAQNDGGYGARPPILPAGGRSELSMECGDESHTEIDFVFRGTAELLVDGETYENPVAGEYIGAYWQQKRIVVPEGKHSYVWRVTTENAGRPDFLLDTVKCDFVKPARVTTGTYGFDQGFPPEEFEGFEGEPSTRWQITNTAQHDGGYGVQAPLLAADGSAELSMDCGADGHNLLEFVFRGSAELLVDGISYENPIAGEYIGSYWQHKMVPVDSGTHRYVWRVTTENAGRPDFSLDTVKCIPM